MGEVSPCKENTGQVQVLGIEPFRMSNPEEPDVAQFMDQCKQARSMLGCWVEMVKCDGVFFFVSERVKNAKGMTEELGITAQLINTLRGKVKRKQTRPKID